MKKKKLSRRDFLRMSALSAAAVALPQIAGTTPAVRTTPPRQEQIELEFLAFSAFADEVHVEAIELFEEAHPEIALTKSMLATGDWNDLLAKVNSRIAAADPPDLIPVPTYGQFINWGRKGVLVDLDDLIAGDPDFEGDPIPPSLLDLYRVDGGLYGIPKDYVTHAVIYNKTMFEEAGIEEPSPDWTWDDLLEKALALTTGEGPDKIFGWLTETGVWSNEHWWWLNEGPGLFDRRTGDRTTPTAAHPKNIEAVQWLVDTILEHEISPTPDDLSTENASSRQLTGRMAMWHGTTIGTVTLLQNTDKLDWYVVPTPRAFKGGPTASMVWTSGFGIVAETAYPQECFSFLKHMSIGDGAAVLGRTGFSIPSGKPEAFLTDEMVARGGQVFVDAASYDVTSTDSNGVHHVELGNVAIWPTYQAIFLGEMGVEEGMQEMQTLMEEVLAEAEME